jgi:hypothetical protein
MRVRKIQSSLFGLFVSVENKKLYNSDSSVNVLKLFYVPLTLWRSKLESLLLSSLFRPVHTRQKICNTLHTSLFILSFCKNGRKKV